MDSFTIVPTSNQSADCDPIVLWKSEERRIVFKPTLVENKHNEAACIDGVFTWQRKRKKDEWEDHNEVPLNTLRADEWVRIRLGAKEVWELARHLGALYRFHASDGLPKRKVHLLKVDLDEEEAEGFRKLDVAKILTLSRRTGIDVASQLLEWIAAAENAPEAVDHLRRLEPEALQRLSSLAGLSALRSVLERWRANDRNAEEAFWQSEFERNAFVLSQAFAFPVVIIKGKAYLGGKRIDNKGGKLVDFLAANPLTCNPVIIEIKTPATDLLGRKYRGGVFPSSEELNGAVAQVLNYKLTLTAARYMVTRDFEEELQVFSPHCLVVAGHTDQLSDGHRKQSFELLRSAYKDVVVLTYDELFEKLANLVGTLEASDESNAQGGE